MNHYKLFLNYLMVVHEFMHIYTYVIDELIGLAMANSKNSMCFLVVYPPSGQVAKTHAAHQRETSE